ncbi:MAG: polyprenyl synthetase family protein [Chloroflexi bacterium]|nr:MAG: polyprenyl synthetase family protein [Chloroflexota bacterium]
MTQDAPDSQQLAARIERYRPLILEEMRAVVGADPAGMFSWMRYHLGWEDMHGAPAAESPGKMLRSVAVLLAAELVGGSAEAAVPAAAAVDLVHNFSLLHDDIEDASDTRRGRATVWSFAGIPQAINTGDAMFTLARLAMHRLQEAGEEERRVLEAMRELDEACLRLVEGQYLDMAFETRSDVTPGEYVTMAAGKTAAMFGAPFAIGALLGGADGTTVSAFRRFGTHLGLAFQAIDDLLDIWGDPATTGKPLGGDLLSRKRTYPVVASIEAGGAAAEALRAAYGVPPQPDEDYRALAALVEAAGGRAATVRLAREQLDEARRSLASSHLDADALALLEQYAQAATGRIP